MRHRMRFVDAQWFPRRCQVETPNTKVRFNETLFRRASQVTGGHIRIRGQAADNLPWSGWFGSLTADRFRPRLEAGVNMPSLQDGGVSNFGCYKHFVPNGTGRACPVIVTRGGG